MRKREDVSRVSRLRFLYFSGVFIGYRWPFPTAGLMRVEGTRAWVRFRETHGEERTTSVPASDEA